MSELDHLLQETETAEEKPRNRTIEEIVGETNIADVYRAIRQLDGVTRKTSLIESDFFSSLCGNTVLLKPENLQKTGSFKLRGAYNRISQLTDAEKAKGVITASAGNHAQGVAYAAKELGVKAVICMPATTPMLKVEATRAYGVEVVLAGDTFDDAYQKSQELKDKCGYVYIHPFNDLEVILGQGTVAKEIIDNCKDIDCILVPIGGGGFASGVALTAKMLNPAIKVIGVEPEGAPSMKASFNAGHVTSLDYVDTVADGCAVKTPGDLTYAFCQKYLDAIVTVSEMEIMSAFLLLIEKHKLICEGAGALTIAALEKLPFKDKKVAAIISGGNIDISTIAALVDKALIARGRIFCFNVPLPDKPGQLLTIANILATENANVIHLDHNQTTITDSFKKVLLGVTTETNGHEHIARITAALSAAGYDITRVY